MKAWLVVVIVIIVLMFALFMLALGQAASLDKYSRALEDRDQIQAIREYNARKAEKRKRREERKTNITCRNNGERICAVCRILRSLRKTCDLGVDFSGEKSDV